MTQIVDHTYWATNAHKEEFVIGIFTQTHIFNNHLNDPHCVAPWFLKAPNTIGKILQNLKTWDDCVDTCLKNWTTSISKAHNIILESVTEKTTSSLFLIHGEPGCGKTTLAYLWALFFQISTWEEERKRYSNLYNDPYLGEVEMWKLLPAYLPVPHEMIMTTRPIFANPQAINRIATSIEFDGDTNILNRYKTASFLAIDESQNLKLTVKAQGYFHDIIDARYEKNLPTMLLGNMGDKELLAKNGETEICGLIDRLTTIQVHGKSHRLERKIMIH